MRAVRPIYAVTVPGDNEDRLMAKMGEIVGYDDNLVVWRFGFAPNSPLAEATGLEVRDWDSDDEYEGGFVWAIATRKTGSVREVFRGFAIELPNSFQRVIDYEPGLVKP